MGTQRLDLEEFYRESKDACLFSILVNVGDRDVAQDLADEAFARAWASWRSLSRHPAPAAWVVRTAAELEHLPVAAPPPGSTAARPRHARRQSIVIIIDPAAVPGGAGVAIVANVNASPYSVGVGPLV